MRSTTIVTEIDRSESVAEEAAFLVSVILSDRRLETPPLDELEGLAEAAGCRVVGHMMQRRSKPLAATYLGSGKVDELVMLAKAAEADVIVFDN
ncbi:MAG: GTPase HflX, partial [Pirellulales bacterium]|nr:GTPase HflX [Pirellulales bacterium]